MTDTQLPSAAPAPQAGGARADRRRRTGVDAPVFPAPRTPRLMLVGRALLLTALLSSLASRGAVTYVALLGVLVLAGAALLIGTLSPPTDKRVLRSSRLALLVAAVLVAYLLVQSYGFHGNALANPLWSYVGRLLGPAGASISVDPAATRDSAFALVLPFAFYAAALALFPRDEGALRLLTWLAGIGLIVALFGLLQFVFFPHSLLLVPKTAYLDSLTGVFVNRNTAGTFLGVASLILLTLTILALPRRGPGALVPTALSGDVQASSPWSRMVWAWLAAIVVVLLALFLTRSRGALLATALAFIVVLPFLILDPRGRLIRTGTRSLRWSLAIFGGVILAVLLVAGLLGGQAIQRMDARGFDEVRLCVYRAALDAFGQNWRFGTGFGTFASVFPIYRLPGCGAPSDIVLRAHNLYLEGLVGLGVGFVPVLLLGYAHILGGLAEGLKRRRRLWAVPLMAVGVVVLVSLHGLVDFSLQIPGMAAYLATFLAAAMTISLGRSARKDGGYLGVSASAGEGSASEP